MAFHPGTRLVYLPAMELGSLFKVDPDFQVRPAGLNTGLDYGRFTIGASDSEAPIESSGALLAWDPVAQREVWRVQHATAWNGGALATAGNLVFQGTADGRFAAYRATDGAKLWESPAGTAVMAGPVSYQVDGVQYVAVAAGWGSGFALSAGPAALAAGVRGAGRVLAFALDRHGEVPPAPPAPGPVPEPPRIFEPTEEQLARGGRLYAGWCMPCHGPLAIGGGSIADLRYATAETHASFAQIVLGGLRAERGMPAFADVLTPDDARAIQGYVLALAADAARAGR
jgi:mono/diheme cytochrome c family protein